MAKFSAEVLLPTNKTVDPQRCTYYPDSREVTTPDGFPEAYSQFSEAGWISLGAPEE